MFKLNIFYTETYDSNFFAIRDASAYFLTQIYNPKITICVPGFGDITIPFVPNTLNIFDSTKLGITEIGCEHELPDGIYKFKYCISEIPLTITTSKPKESCVYKSFFRINKLQEKFHNAFLKLQISECNETLKKQEMLHLNTINILIQGAIAAANSCSEKQAMILYKKASLMLDRFSTSDCKCH